MNQKGAVPVIVVIVLLLIGLVVTLKLSQTQQIFKPKAYDSQGSQQSRFSSNGLNIEVLQLVKDTWDINIDPGSYPAVITHNKVYFKENRFEPDSSGRQVYSININDDGILANPTTQNLLPKGHSLSSLVNYNTHIYSIGGLYDGESIRDGRKVYKSEILENGNLSEWQEVTSLPTAIHNASVFAYKNKLYVLGGYLDEAKRQLDKIYSIRINADGSLDAAWEEIGQLPTPMLGTSIAFDGTYLYLIDGHSGWSNLSLYSSKILENGSFDSWQNLTPPQIKNANPTIHLLGGKLLIFATPSGENNGRASIYHTAVLNGGVGQWTRSEFSRNEIHFLGEPLIFSGNIVYNLTINSPKYANNSLVRTSTLGFEQTSPSPTPVPSSFIPTPPNPSANVSGLQTYALAKTPIGNVFTDNFENNQDVSLKFKKSKGINFVNLWVDYCERWNNDGTCNFETGQIITQKEVPLDFEGELDLSWSNTHPKHTLGSHKVGVHAYYCTPGTKNCVGFPVISKDINIARGF